MHLRKRAINSFDLRGNWLKLTPLGGMNPNNGEAENVRVYTRDGHDIRHGLIGPGVYASHGYERSHKKGVQATLQLLDRYLK